MELVITLDMRQVYLSTDNDIKTEDKTHISCVALKLAELTDKILIDGVDIKNDKKEVIGRAILQPTLDDILDTNIFGDAK